MRSSECPPSDRRENVNAVSGSTPYARLAGRARSYRDPNFGGRRTDASGCVGRRSHGDRSTVSEWTAAFVPAWTTCAHDLCSHADDQLIGFAYDPKCIRLALQGFNAGIWGAVRGSRLRIFRRAFCRRVEYRRGDGPRTLISGMVVAPLPFLTAHDSRWRDTFAANTGSTPRRWATHLRMSAPSGPRMGPALRRCPPGVSPWPLAEVAPATLLNLPGDFP